MLNYQLAASFISLVDKNHEDIVSMSVVNMDEMYF